MSCPRQFSTLRRQRGIALVMIMLIVAVVTTVAVEISWKFNLHLSRGYNRFLGMQAKAMLDSGELYAQAVLIQDAVDTPYDSLDDDWAQEIPPLPLPELDGYLAGRLEDAHARINLNVLGTPYNKTASGGMAFGAKRYSEPQRRFIRLLQTIPLDEERTTFLAVEDAELLLDAVKDWLDPDSEGLNGFESDYYEQLPYPLTIANGPMASVSELQVIAGMTPVIYRALLPHVIALPPNASGFNINTLSPVLLRTINAKDLLTPLSEEDAQSLADLTSGAGFESQQAFAESDIVKTLFGDPKNVDLQDIDTQSEFFIFTAEVGISDHVRRGKSLLERRQGAVITLRRSDANL